MERVQRQTTGQLSIFGTVKDMASKNFRNAAKNTSICLLLITILSLLHGGKLYGSPTIIDARGKTIQVERPFTRIISLYSGHTENLCSLGAEKQLIGISRNDDFPPSVQEKFRLSYREDPEKFLALEPDLVLIRPMIDRAYPQFVKKLEGAGIQVISLQPNGMDEMFRYWQDLAILTGREEQAQVMIDQFTDRLTRMQDTVDTYEEGQRPKVYFQSIHSKMKTFASNSLGAYVLRMAGGINIADDARQVRATNIAYYGKEQLLAKANQIDFFIAQQGRMNPIDESIIYNEPGFAAIKAIQEKKVYLLEEALVSRPTLRLLDGIDQMHNILYHNQLSQ